MPAVRIDRLNVQTADGYHVCTITYRYQLMAIEQVKRLSAFTTDPAGGNPAGVWIGEHLPTFDTMQAIAKEIGYSETAFIAPSRGSERTIRYFSPEAEVPFCGHATIASGVQLGNEEGVGEYVLDTKAGTVNVAVRSKGGQSEATLVSVATKYKSISDADLTDYLSLFGWGPDQLDPSIPAAIAYAGAWHLVVATRDRATLAEMDYDFDQLKTRMARDDLTTIQVIFRESDTVVHSRNPFPPGGVVEDPATGAAAAALGGYLRDAGLVSTPFEFKVQQGEDMGRPSELRVAVGDSGGVSVSGFAVAIS